ncbi:methanol oxidation system protein MoxJ [Paracoccus shanxieyensis]|uniref:Methanol oxidation system protein MoxJ n=1 Tax=Paracoccus shanxieyensis TaxID=2675752 RepID=A0A6L6IU41_9RHOB|nr:methanol oxidation system protein MoxJ [Paracoccus shanxieyensis]MTH64055.1 methanol oxidation system protein MoxJ [Paracoccus shanxieyensis]MTH86904.1 methanol oxidation system protein MoxJ [Paracoccus shanxieyensis]
MSKQMLTAGIAALTLAAPALADTQTLRVCASTKDAPYSDKDGGGFENKIAQVLADEMGATLDLVMIDREAIYLVRDGIDKDLCDVLVGVDAGDQRLLTSEPYYRSGYAFVTQQSRDFTGDTWQAVDQDGFNTFSYRLHSPAETILKYTGRYEYNLIYQASLTNFEDRRNKYTQVEASRVVAEVAGGGADLAIIFAPEAARYVRDAREPLRMTLITNEIERSDGVIIPLQYSQSVGVSNAHPDLLAPINAALTSGRAKIDAILTEEGIPLLPLS